MKKKYLITGEILFLSFLVFTLLVVSIDRNNIGPNDSIVGFSTLNKWFSNLVGVNFILYTVIDYAEILAILTLFLYGFIGLIQLIKRKSIKEVDKDILFLGGLYSLVLAIFLLFNLIKINFRPVLIDDVLEVSYPSSTILLSITFMIPSIHMTNKYIENVKTKKIIEVISIIYMLFLCVGRILSGVHWLSDIIGSTLLGLSIVFIYLGLVFVDKENDKLGENNIGNI